MKVHVGCGNCNTRENRVIVEEGTGKITVEFPNTYEKFISVVDLENPSSSGSKERNELVQKIESLYVNPNDPCFRIFFKDGRNIWITIRSDKLEIYGYPNGSFSGMPSYVKASFPEKTQEPVSQID